MTPERLGSTAKAQGTALRATALLALLVLEACASTHGLKPQAAVTAADSLAASRALGDTGTDPAAWPSPNWWARFGDPQLDRLISEGLAGGPSLKVAAARARQASALADAAASTRSPRVDSSLSATRERFPARALIPPPYAGGWGTLDQLQATLSWDLDFWGKNRATFEQALGQARAAAVDAQAAQLALSVDIAHAYVQLTRAYLQLDVAQATVDQRERIFALTRARCTRAGRAAERDDRADPRSDRSLDRAGTRSRAGDRTASGDGRRRRGAAVAGAIAAARAQARHRRPALARGGGSPRHRRGSDAVLPGRQPDGLRRLSEPGNLGLPGPGQPGARSRTRAEPAAVRRGAAPRQSGRRRCAVRRGGRAVQPDAVRCAARGGRSAQLVQQRVAAAQRAAAGAGRFARGLRPGGAALSRGRRQLPAGTQRRGATAGAAEPGGRSALARTGLVDQPGARAGGRARGSARPAGVRGA